MNNEFILDLARQQNARITIFVQEKDQPWCEAFVANWIRRRSKVGEGGRPKTLFDGAKSHMFRKEPSNHGEETWAVKPLHGAPSKFESMQQDFRRTGDAVYIAHGGWKRREELAMDKRKPTLAILRKIKDREVGEGGAGFYEMLREIKAAEAIASVGIGNGLRWSHAVGVDFRPGEAVYFDPQLGEITFARQFELIDWWADCREKWEDHLEDKEENAFNIFPERALAWATLWKVLES